MADNGAPSREEVNAKLEAAATRTESRFENVSVSLELRFLSIAGKLDKLAESVSALTASLTEVKAENRATRWLVISVVGAAFIAITAVIVAGMAVLWATQGTATSASESVLRVQDIRRASAPPYRVSLPNARR